MEENILSALLWSDETKTPVHDLFDRTFHWLVL
jgi:hypothetical protein